MVAALSMVLMMLTGLIPMAEFALPAMAGVLLVAMVVEISPKWALMVYLAVAILSMLLAPSKDSAVFYAVFLGWYPIAKQKLECLQNPIWEWGCKLLIFNLAIAAGAAVLIFLFRLNDYLEMLGESVWTLLLGGVVLNGTFLVYDIALTRAITVYLKWFRPKYLKKGHLR